MTRPGRPVRYADHRDGAGLRQDAPQRHIVGRGRAQWLRGGCWRGWRGGFRTAARRLLSSGLRETVRQAVHPHHQRRRRADLALQVGAQLVGGHADPGRELGHPQPRSLISNRTWRATSARSLASRWARARSSTSAKALEMPWDVVRQHLLDLAGGAPVRVTFHGDRDRFQVAMSPPSSAERIAAVGQNSTGPLAHCGGRTGGGRCRRRVAARVRCQRHLASSSIATATDRHLCLTSDQSASGSSRHTRRYQDPTAADRPGDGPAGWRPSVPGC